MADIVDFRGVPSKRLAPAPTQRRAQSAEIVIFPGVRYQRWDEQPAEATQAAGIAAKPTHAKKSRKKRDTLELVDA